MISSRNNYFGSEIDFASTITFRNIISSRNHYFASKIDFASTGMFAQYHMGRHVFKYYLAGNTQFNAQTRTLSWNIYK